MLLPVLTHFEYIFSFWQKVLASTMFTFLFTFKRTPQYGLVRCLVSLLFLLVQRKKIILGLFACVLFTLTIMPSSSPIPSFVSFFCLSNFYLFLKKHVWSHMFPCFSKSQVLFLSLSCMPLLTTQYCNACWLGSSTRLECLWGISVFTVFISNAYQSIYIQYNKYWIIVEW